MSRLQFEQRAILNGVMTALSGANWTDLRYTEGWDEMDISTPLVNVYVIDDHKVNLELGYQSSTHKLFNRVIQVDCFMETEDRVKSMCEDIMDYLDAASVEIVDLLTTSGVGYLSFPNSETITSTTFPPSFNNPEILRWRGSVRGAFEAYYPAGGQPI